MKDIEVVSPNDLKSYFISRDITLNEVLLIKGTDDNMYLWYSDGAKVTIILSKIHEKFIWKILKIS